MNSRERVLTALDHKEPDRVPVDLGTTNSTGIAKTAYANLLKFLGKDGQEIKTANLMQQLAVVDEEILEQFGVDTRGLSPNATREVDLVKMDGALSYFDEWGIGWKMPENGFYFDMVHHPLKDIEEVNEIDKYSFPLVANPKRIAGFKDRAVYIKNNLDKAVFIRGIVPGTMEFAAWMRGYEQFFMDFYLNPDIAERLLDKALEIKLDYWNMVIDELGNDIDIINESDDLGSQQGPLISLDMYRKFLKPRHKELVSSIKKRTSAKVFLHSCGAIYQFIPDLIDVGFDILNPVQATANGMDPVRLKKEFGNDITFWGGGVDTQDILPKGTPGQVKDEVKKRLEQLASGGGYVFAPIHNIQADVPPENIIAMYEAFFENCKY